LSPINAHQADTAKITALILLCGRRKVLAFKRFHGNHLTPVIDRGQRLDAARSASNLPAHACAIVRGAINPMRLAKTKAAIDEAYRAKPGLHVHDADLLEVTSGLWSG
jgi:hypothetical protein